ncbi:MAG: hypothetical protein IKV14_06640 [Muribaculaceae bacterium]|nr:hypothetical protein [Muribaculaceae bacterium]
MIWRVIKIILILLLPACLIAAYFYAQYKYTEEVCNNIKVVLLNPKEQQYLSEEDILKIVSDNKLAIAGVFLYEINLDKIEKTIQKNQIVKNNECYKTSNGDIVIEVEQRIPELRVITPATSYYIDSDRRKLPLSEKIVAYLPIATGNIKDEFAQNNLYDFVQYLKENKKWENQIEEIIVTDEEEIELIPRIGKQLILFGKMSNFEKKFNAIDLLYTQVFSKTGWNYYNKIDLRYEGKIICTKNIQ